MQSIRALRPTTATAAGLFRSQQSVLLVRQQQQQQQQRQARRGFAGKSLKKYKNLERYESKAEDGDSTLEKRLGVGQHPLAKKEASRAASKRADEDGDNEDDLAKLAGEKQHPALATRMVEMFHPPKAPIEDRRPEDIEVDRQYIAWYQEQLQAYQDRINFHLNNRLRQQRMAVHALPKRWRRLALVPDKSVWHPEIPMTTELPPWWMAKGRTPGDIGLGSQVAEGEDREFFGNVTSDAASASSASSASNSGAAAAQ